MRCFGSITGPPFPWPSPSWFCSCAASWPPWPPLRTKSIANGRWFPAGKKSRAPTAAGTKTGVSRSQQHSALRPKRLAGENFILWIRRTLRTSATVPRFRDSPSKWAKVAPAANPRLFTNPFQCHIGLAQAACSQNDPGLQMDNPFPLLLNNSDQKNGRPAFIVTGFGC